MKFYIKRTSHGAQFMDANPHPPCDGAVEDGHDYGIQLYSIDIRDLDHLIELAAREGSLIIDVNSSIDPGPQLEIYDDYKE